VQKGHQPPAALAHRQRFEHLIDGHEISHRNALNFLKLAAPARGFVGMRGMRERPSLRSKKSTRFDLRELI
jgi:hypothetical protein